MKCIRGIVFGITCWRIPSWMIIAARTCCGGEKRNAKPRAWRRFVKRYVSSIKATFVWKRLEQLSLSKINLTWIFPILDSHENSAITRSVSTRFRVSSVSQQPTYTKKNVFQCCICSHSDICFNLSLCAFIGL
jgi:hypothetical protein